MNSTSRHEDEKRASGVNARGLSALGVALLLALATTGMAAPGALAAPGQDEAAPGWIVGSAPHLDLWFHGLAVVGFSGSGPMPLYDSDYGAAVQQLKQEQGVFPTVLDERASSLASEFASDPGFELAHFLPLYFVSADRARMFDALQKVARDGNADAVTDFRAKFGAGVVAQVLTEADQRQALANYALILEQEWGAFYEDFWNELASSRQDLYQELQLRWDHELAPRLQAYLHAARLDRGAIVVSPVIGAEGRIFEGDPRQRDDNLIVVGFPLGSSDLDAVLANVVRELSFPLLRRVLNSTTAAGRDPAEAEAESSLAAVRTGALLLQRYAPDQVEAYQRSFVRARQLEPASGAALVSQFEAAFPISADLARALVAEVDR